MANDIVPIQDATLAARVESLLSSSAPDKDGDFLDELEERLEFAGIMQPTTSSVDEEGVHEGIKMGDFYTKFGVLGNPITGVPLAMWNSRVYFNRDTNKQVCSSPDGKTPIHNDIANNCKTCPKARYGKKSPSPCTSFLNILFQPADLSTKPFVLQFSKTAKKVGMDIVRQVKSFGENTYDTTFTLKTIKAEGYNYRKPTIEGAVPTPDEMKSVYQVILDHYKPIVTNAITRHLDDGPDEADSDEVETPDNIA